MNLYRLDEIDWSELLEKKVAWLGSVDIADFLFILRVSIFKEVLGYYI